MSLLLWARRPGGWRNLQTGEFVEVEDPSPGDVVGPWSAAAFVDTAIVPPAPPMAGALPLGHASYPIPDADVVFLSLTGSDAADGLTADAPKATLQAAVAACPDGGTIVVRGGTRAAPWVYEQDYSGTLTKPLTIQNYANPALGVCEAVIFDGSRQRTTWTNNGDGTWSAALFAQFDHTTPGGYAGGIDPAWPMAVWPDMVHVDGTRLDHRPSNEVPGAGQFTMDYAANRVRIGVDPAGREVRLSNLGRFMVVRAPNVTIRGIGIRRYATTLTYSTGTLDVSAPGFLLENVVMEDCGQQSLALGPSADRFTVADVTLRRSAQLNLMGNGVDSYVIRNVVSELANFNRWDNEPGAGGMKLARATNGVVADSIIRDNLSSGIWFDVSCWNNTIVNNWITGNRGPAIEYEISRRALIVNNWITGAGTTSIWALDGAEVRVWNNVVDRATAYDLRFEEDSRAGNVSSGENPDGIQTWTTEDIEVCNNVLANYSGRTGVWRLYAGNISIAEDAAVFLNRVAGNVWSAPSTGSAARMAAVENAAGEVVSYTTPAAFSSAMPPGMVGTNILAVFTAPKQAQISAWASIADPVPADVAALLGVPTGTKVVGPVRPCPVDRT